MNVEARHGGRYSAQLVGSGAAQQRVVFEQQAAAICKPRVGLRHKGAQVTHKEVVARRYGHAAFQLDDHLARTADVGELELKRLAGPYQAGKAHQAQHPFSTSGGHHNYLHVVGHTHPARPKRIVWRAK